MPRVALIDNATLTAAQRLLGGIKVKNLYNIDGDIEAFESLVQSILFFDEICCIDDYKEQFRSSRARQFDFIRFLSRDEIDYERQIQLAKDDTTDLMLKVKGHEIAQAEFREFFDLLRSHLVFNWKMSSSIFYLTVNLLGDQSGTSVESYSSLHAMIASQRWGEETGEYVPPSMTIKDKRGTTLPESFVRGGEFAVGKQVQDFAASLNWLALKTSFYVRVGSALNMDIVLHPIRHAFLTSVIQKGYRLPSSVFEVVTNILRNGVTGTVHTITQLSEPVVSEMKLPMWSAYLATKTRDPLDFFEICKHLREEGVFVEARTQLQELQDLNESHSTGNYVTKVNELNLALAGTAQRLLTRYGVSSKQQIPLAGAANLLIKAKTGLSIPDGLGQVPRPRKFAGVFDQWGFRGLMRSVVSDLVSIERLGKLHEVITSRVQRESTRKFPIHEEGSAWLGKDSPIRKWL